MTVPRPGPVTPARAAPRKLEGRTTELEAPAQARGRCLEPPARGPPMHCLEQQPADPRLEAGASSWGGSPAPPAASSTSSRTAQLELGQLTSDRLELGSAPAQGDSSWGGPHRLEVPQAGLCSG
ncbi:hypothetical protein Salat_2532000 [Sesamum alatum]|uniref:Uncharacterized protein n=1 Tax=Sesamum alatum TaxID=300844 RepID=A0AAE2CCK1_9LAMI|nr:hypothetical protein Salat_2532000 [Sesamum alatum]